MLSLVLYIPWSNRTQVVCTTNPIEDRASAECKSAVAGVTEREKLMLNRLWCSTENPEVVTHLQSHRRYIHSSIGQRTCEEFYSVDSHCYVAVGSEHSWNRATIQYWVRKSFWLLAYLWQCVRNFLFRVLFRIPEFLGWHKCKWVLDKGGGISCFQPARITLQLNHKILIWYSDCWVSSPLEKWLFKGRVSLNFFILS